MASFAELSVQLELQQSAFNKGMDDAARRLSKLQTSARQTQGSMQTLERSMSGVAAAVGTLASAFAAFKGVGAIVEASDKIRNLQGSFTALLGDAGRAGDMLGRVFAIVERTGAPLDAAASAVQRLSIALQPLGASNAQIAQIAESFLKIGKVGGASAQEASGALVQLAQALSAGKLGGDELKSILESVPLAGKVIADSLGVPLGKLKELGSEGKLSADLVANSFLKAAASIDAQFAQLPVTFDQAWNKVAARATNVAAEFDKLSGTSQTLVTLTTFIGDQLQRWHAELVLTNTSLSQTQTMAEAWGFALKLVAAAIVGIDFGVEQIVKRMALWLQYAQALINLDWASMDEALKRFNEQFDRAAARANQAIEEIFNPNRRTAPPEMFGPPVPPALLRPPPQTAGGASGSKGKSEAEREAEALKKQGDALAAMLDPLNAYNQKMAELNKLVAAGAIGSVTHAKALEAYKIELTSAGDALTASVDPAFAYELEMRKINAAYRDGAIEVETWVKLMERAKEAMEQAKTGGKKPAILQLAEGIATATGKGVGQFFEDIMSGSVSAATAFNRMVASIIGDLARLLAELAAKAAAKFIIKSIFGGATGGGGGVSASGAGPTLSLSNGGPSLLSAPSFDAAASLGLMAAPFAEPAPAEGIGTGVMGAETGAGRWQVVINNNAPGVDVSSRERADGGLDVTIERVRAALTNDVARGGNQFSRALEGAYALGRGR